MNQPIPKTTAPSPKGKPRPRADVSFPYYDLDSSVAVAEVLHTQAGGACSRDQIAPLIGYSGTKNGGFLSRIGAAKMFGLIEEAGGVLRLSQLSTKILSPVAANDVQRGKVEAFLGVELFLKVYERFKGQTLPSSTGLENLFRNEYKIGPAQLKTATRVLMESAQSAGFFDAAGRTRLVLPLAANVGVASGQPAAPVSLGDDDGLPVVKHARRAPAADPIETQIPAAIFGLIRDLPPEGTTMSQPRRQRLIKAFEASINWLYPDDSEEVANE